MGQKVLGAGILLLFGMLVFAQTNMPQSDEISGAAVSGIAAMPPLELLRPRYGEEPRFPQDFVIGTLGRGNASEESYRYALLLTGGLAAGNGIVQGVHFPEQKRLSIVQNLSGLGMVRSWRVGGGRIEPDGSVSFLIRFLGRERSITGELYLRQAPAAHEQQHHITEIAETEITEIEVFDAAEGEYAALTPLEIEPVYWWLVDDVLLEPPRGLAEGRFGPGGGDMTPYERFF